MTLPPIHPYWHVQNLTKSLSDELSLEFSTYVYSPQTVEDERDIFRVRNKNFSPEFIETSMTKLSSNQELAFHSRVWPECSDVPLHIPLIDFAGHLTKRDLDILKVTIGVKNSEVLAIYQSGRSYHGYVNRLLDHQSWVEFMGTLLLANLPGRPDIIDTRWVGHRLIAGYAALRWSCNTDHYLLSPSVVPFPK